MASQVLSWQGRLPAGQPVALPEMPPVWLAEAYGDYHAVAKSCGGRDEGWVSLAAF